VIGLRTLFYIRPILVGASHILRDPNFWAPPFDRGHPCRCQSERGHGHCLRSASRTTVRRPQGRLAGQAIAEWSGVLINAISEHVPVLPSVFNASRQALPILAAIWIHVHWYSFLRYVPSVVTFQTWLLLITIKSTVMA